MVAFIIFWQFTFGVLMLMDLMEAFLHTLRLHWVEFQNKFFSGGGIRYAPFSTQTFLETEMINPPRD